MPCFNPVRKEKRLGAVHTSMPNSDPRTKKSPGKFYRPRNHETPFFKVEACLESSVARPKILFVMFMLWKLMAIWVYLLWLELNVDIKSTSHPFILAS